jgi:hypothetical protein
MRPIDVAHAYRGKSPAARLMLFVLTKYTNIHGQNAFPSIPELMEASGLSRGAVHNAINLLIADGAITRLTRRDGQRQDTNIYSINVRVLEMTPSASTSWTGGRPPHGRGEGPPQSPPQSPPGGHGTLRNPTESIKAREPGSTNGHRPFSFDDPEPRAAAAIANVIRKHSSPTRV